MKKVIVIGSGFSSLSAASYLAKEGLEVSIFEKNDTPAVEPVSLKEMDILSIWAPLGIGCLIFSRTSFKILERPPVTSTN
jgi:2-polyprenyl-6-methoxyphenol hydroxylase-like FAD-dependent oxidoreductase